LADAGIPSVTLQRHLAQPAERPDAEKHLYVLDESSLASTRQMHTLLAELGRDDRVLLVGDTRQHHAVEAGRPYQQLQTEGLDTARLDDIIRQQDPALRVAVEHLSRGEVGLALGQLEREGRVHQIADHRERLEAIARDYVGSPDRTLVVSPDNQSRREINGVIHRERQLAGQVDRDEHHVRVFVPRQDLTGVDRQWAARYEAGDVVRYTTGSRTVGVAAGEYARVEQVDPSRNRLTVVRDGGEHVTYDPRRLHGVTMYREEERAFSVGDRVQVTASDRERQLANRELGTLEQIDPGSERTLQVRLDSGRTAAFERETPLHLDYGYAVTSHSSQGQTADRVLVHVDTDRAGEALVNRRFAYVALSRSRYDAHVYTNDRIGLAESLGREHTHRSAIEPVAGPQAGANTMEKTIALTPTIEHGFDR
jgi:ATP-dependent exoDNAse (exonuclease V) alpha subunit